MKTWKNEAIQSLNVEHNGFRISVSRSFSLAGYSMTYFSAVRESDGWFLMDEFTEGEDELDVIASACKKRIDEHLKGKK